MTTPSFQMLMPKTLQSPWIPLPHAPHSIHQQTLLAPSPVHIQHQTTCSLTPTLVPHHLDYCTSLLIGLPVFTFALPNRFSTQKPHKSKHVTSLYKSLQWFASSFRMKLKPSQLQQAKVSHDEALTPPWSHILHFHPHSSHSGLPGPCRFSAPTCSSHGGNSISMTGPWIISSPPSSLDSNVICHTFLIHHILNHDSLPAFLLWEKKKNGLFSLAIITIWHSTYST